MRQFQADSRGYWREMASFIVARYAKFTAVVLGTWPFFAQTVSAE